MMKIRNAQVNGTQKWIALTLAAMLLLCAWIPGALATEATAAPVAEALTLEEAVAAALQAAQLTETDVVMTKLSKDYDDGRWEFEIEFVSGGLEYEYEIDAQTGAVLKSSTETVSERMSALYQAEYIGVDAAKAKALEKAGVSAEAAVFTEIQLDYDDGQMEYELEFTADGQSHHVDLDAVSGEVLRYTSQAERTRK